MIEAAYMVGFFKHVWELCELDDLGVIRGGIVIVAGEYFVSEPIFPQHGLEYFCEQGTCVRLESC